MLSKLGNMTQLAECLTSTYKAPDLIRSTIEPVCNGGTLITHEVEAEGQRIHKEFPLIT